MNHKELIERLRIKAGHNQYKFSDALMIESADAIESLLAENERLKADLSKYRDAPVVGWQWLSTGTYRKNITNAAIYSDWRPLIVKPGE